MGRWWYRGQADWWTSITRMRGKEFQRRSNLTHEDTWNTAFPGRRDAVFLYASTLLVVELASFRLRCSDLIRYLELLGYSLCYHSVDKLK